MKQFYFLSLLLITSLYSNFAFAQFPEKTLPIPTEFECTDAAPKIYEILYGAEPQQVPEENKPVLIFVHGWMDNGYGWFLMGNQMYPLAFNNGYRTAFLHQSQVRSLKRNGQDVADMIRQVSAHYNNTKNIVLITHSKGGLDAEQAMVNYGVDSLVRACICLSVPFYGAPLADWSSSFLQPVIDIIPIFGAFFKAKGTIQLQTAYLNKVVRPQIDNSPNNHPEKFITLGGWGYNKDIRLSMIRPLDLITFMSYDRPNCDLAPVGVLYGRLISILFNVTGRITKYTSFPYSVPIDGGKEINDGLCPYYSSMKPGGYNASAPPFEESTNWNHFDFLWGETSWPQIHEQLTNIEQNFPGRLSSPIQSTPVENNFSMVGQSLVCNKLGLFTMISDEYGLLSVNILGQKNGQSFKIKNSEGLTVKEFSIPADKNNTRLVIPDYNASFILQPNETYSLESDGDFLGTWEGKKLPIDIKYNTEIGQSPSYDNDLEIDFTSKEITDHELMNVVIDAYLKPTIDLSGEEMSGKTILLHPTWNNATNKLSLDFKELNIADGIYNLSLMIEHRGNNCFYTTSMAFNKQVAKPELSDKSLNFYPNPAKNVFSIDTKNMLPGNYLLVLNNLEGGEMMKEYVSLENGPEPITIQLDESIANGLYFLTLNNNEKTFSGKIVVQR